MIYFILIIMHNHPSYPNVTTVIQSYNRYNPTIDNSTIETPRDRGLGTIVKCTPGYYSFRNYHARVFRVC